MKRLIAYLIILCTSGSLIGQEISQIRVKIDSLTTLREQFQNQIELINKEIDDLNWQLSQSQQQIKPPELRRYRIKTDYSAPVLNEPSVIGKEIYKLEKGAIVESTDKLDGFVHVTWEGKSGYIHYGYLDDYDKFLQQTNEQKKQELLRQETIRKQELLRQETIRNKYRGSRYMQSIIDHKIQIGMTSSMVLDSWGSPVNINKTVTISTISEQWVYTSDYLYFENGVLTSYQTHR